MIGLGTYAFFWAHSERAPAPLSLIGAFEATRELDVDLFQICDYAPLTEMSDREVRDAARAARELGLRIELGTKGIDTAHLERFLALAEMFDATLLRSMVFGPDSRPSLDEAGALLRDIRSSLDTAGVTLALETYEQIATADLVRLVRDADSPRIGVCLDPANVVARLEPPRACVEEAADLVVDIHVKDFAFDRQPGWVGFTYSGARMGEGLHDYRHLVDTVRPRQRGISEIVEHWLPWQGDPETTIRTERDWTRATLDHLRSIE
ncbi:sugar phosphate isomerase/epimerase [Microbacterium sp. 77mftsu3.1]|uniref:sugar phosphate isomerase/epimerase family protein n=1 Tax=Microbacterium sp. 77mftsu3.1 TaxID=1761802 RepID=UPI00036ABC05|nr:TIM barrel protein [Microbacterium sp. 77mftsu3.1]SDG68147.1 Sugar phosphate isomerase/epimerase [Microbacterium sp. 77mftsu3.1]